MKKLNVFLVLFAVVFATYNVNAGPIRFKAQYLSFELGFVEYDTSAFSGSGLQLIGNDSITDLAFDVPGVVFGFSDVLTSSGIIFDVSGLFPRLLGSSGSVANNGSRSLSFLFDGSYDVFPLVGNTSLLVGSSDPFELNPDLVEYPVTWTVDTSGLISVSEPRTLFLLSCGLLLVGFRKLVANSQISKPLSLAAI